MDEWLAILIGCLVAGLYLALAHVLCWGKGEPLAAYTIGTVGLNLGVTVAGVILKDTRLMVVPWVVSIAGGSVVVLCWQVRGWWEEWGRRNKLAKQVLEYADDGTGGKSND